MAVALISKHFLAEAESMSAFNAKWPGAKEVPTPESSLTKCFHIEGWGVPEGEDRMVEILFELTKSGIKVGWRNKQT